VKGFRLGFRVRVKGFSLRVLGVKGSRLGFGLLRYWGEGEGFCIEDVWGERF